MYPNILRCATVDESKRLNFVFIVPHFGKIYCPTACKGSHGVIDFALFELSVQ